MIDHLRKRFIRFNLLVISSIALIIGLAMFIGSPRNNLSSPHRYISSILLVILLVYIGSLILSKVAIRPIQAAWQKQLDFTADASHELRTPITVIQTNLEVVMDNPEETIASQMKWLKNIEAENQRMGQLVADLLTLSRSDTDQQALELQPFVLKDAILEALTPFEPIANEKKIKLHVNLIDAFTFHGDRNRIKQLCVILVDNALQYTDAGTVTVSLTQNEKETTLMVSDTGYGIAPEHLDNIFDRFYRVEKTRTFNQEGSGLGLAIAKWIIQEHGGTVKVESQLGVGTTFVVQLPNKAT